MKCPKCGTEMKDGQLYCEKCGEEIHIVPDFEPEIEYSIRETLSGIVEDVLEEVPGDKSEEREPVSTGKEKYKKIILTVGIVAAGLLFVAVGIIAVLLYRNNSIQYQLSQAGSFLEAGNTDRAIACYSRAIELEEDNVSLRFTLAELYGQVGLTEENIDCLLAIIRSPYATEDEIGTAYKKLIDVYAAKEDYASINTLLVNTENETIRTMFQNYMAVPPEFSYKEGSYTEVVPLKLTASTQGTVYYTLDGTIPDENSTIYTTPIFLETGSYTVTAMFVNAYGIKSEVVAKTYVIDVLKPAAPEVETYSGEYTTPTMIQVIVPTDCQVYYTTDGTIPTDQSAHYIGKIPMPLGKSTFKFIAYNKEGVPGDCTTRQFELALDTDFTPDMALEVLLGAMIERGRIEDWTGTVTGELSGKYRYEFQYALSIPEAGDFYVFSEMYEDTAGVQSRTGTTYVVNAYTREYFKLSTGALDDYILEAF